VFDQPTGRLRKKIDKYEDDQCRDELDAHGCTPLRLTLYKVEAITNELATSNAECL
jgi:hypothetical protein